MRQTNQLELGLPTRGKARRKHQARRLRARWWFEQMRLAAEAAIEWKPASAQPELQAN